MCACQQVKRGYFALGSGEALVSVTSDQDFLVYIWARNVDIFAGGVQMVTPPSAFRTKDASGPNDALTMDVPAQSSVDLGTIGGCGGEAIDFSASRGRVWWSI